MLAFWKMLIDDNHHTYQMIQKELNIKDAEYIQSRDLELGLNLTTWGNFAEKILFILFLIHTYKIPRNRKVFLSKSVVENVL